MDSPLDAQALDMLEALEREAEETTAAAIAHGWRPDIARQQASARYLDALRNAAPALIRLAREALMARSECRCGEPCRMHATLED